MDIVAFLCPMLYQHGNCILKKKGKVQIQIRVCLTIEVALNLGEEIGWNMKRELQAELKWNGLENHWFFKNVQGWLGRVW